MENFAEQLKIRVPTQYQTLPDVQKPWFIRKRFSGQPDLMVCLQFLRWFLVALNQRKTLRKN